MMYEYIFRLYIDLKAYNSTVKSEPIQAVSHMCRNMFWGSCSRAVNAVEWNQFNTGSNPVPIEIFAKYGRIDHLWD